ncbi:MAG TPA: hypothetical protein VHK69_03915, partial [Chitinophagaceae bacterium]|nr:hypothetical protein [Chitinophagaceae bacterium]
KNLFSIDLYVADAETGKVTERVTSTSFNAHVDEYSSYESSVAWSPDSRQLAFVAFAKGRNRLIIAGADNGKISREIDIPGVPSISNPAWSPDGRTIVVTGLVDGQSDLFAYDLERKSVRRLTNDFYADLQPSFSPDGKKLVFATDRRSITGSGIQHHFAHNLALLDMSTGAVTPLDFFNGANNLNPVFGNDNNLVYFLSDRDGFRNLYSYNIASGELLKRTNLFTGITGITMYSPALSAARHTDRVVFSVYNKDEYTIHGAASTALGNEAVAGTAVAMQPGALPPYNRVGESIVQQSLVQTPYEVVPATAFTDIPYKPNFQLDYIGNTGGVGVSTGRYGTGLAGGVNGIFSDILGNNQLFGAVSLNGEIYDVGGQFAYVNQKKRFNWGLSASHIPYLSGWESLRPDTLVNRDGDSVAVANYSLNLLRTFEDQLSVFAAFPFSTIRRLEGGASIARYYYRLDEYADYYDPQSGFYYGQDKTKLPTPEGFTFGQAYMALVGDNSFSGVASPLAGHRFRLEAGQYLGVVNLTSVTADYRRYFRMAPLTLATRNMYLGRFGRDAQTGVLPPLFIGYPSLVRGYNALNFAQETESGGTTGITINDLIGNRIYVGNVELRLPFTGPERLSAIQSKFLFTELNLFTDAGMAWGSAENFNGSKNDFNRRNNRFILSSGVSARVNLFGYLVIEPYYAVPWQNGGFKNGTFGLNFIPGW